MATIKVPATPKHKASTTFVHQVLPISLLHVDRLNYQRDINEPFVEFIVENFDEAILGELIVSHRADGTHYVIDGQQRLSALRRLGWTHAPATVLEGLTIQQEARMFYALDTQRRRLNAMDLFRARVVAEEETALKVMAIVEQAGWQVDLNSATWWTSKPGFIRAVDAAELAMRRYGEHTLLVSLTALRGAWPEDDKAGTRPMVLGLSRLHFTFGDVVKVERLVDKLSLTKPATIIADARALRDATSSRMDEAVAHTMYGRYRKGRGGSSLPKWEDRRLVFSASGTRVAELEEAPPKKRRGKATKATKKETSEPSSTAASAPTMSDEDLQQLIESVSKPYEGKKKQ